VSRAIRIGVDVGGTFTKAVAVETAPLRLLAHAAVPTSHEAEGGVAEGVALALRDLLADLGEDRRRVALVAFSTTQAMNALLVGDVGRVGVLGIGSQPDLRAARKRTRVGSVALAPGHALQTEHAFLDVTGGVDEQQLDAALAALAAAGCASIAVSGALAVDEPDHELLVARCAQERGLAACVGHDLTGAYGLEMRTVSAAVNASILPVVRRTASLVEQALEDAGLDVPLLVLRGDGGAMSVDAFRRRPCFTIGSGPAAGVAAVLHQLQLADAIVVECGGTSSNVSIVKRGRPVVRSLRVMGRPTCVRAVDSWVVGAAGGSMALVKRSSIAQTGPRSAHIAGLPYACFADPSELEGAQLELVAPREGDPEAYACIRAGGTRYALTATCAANALGIVPRDAYSFAPPEAALAAFGPLAKRLKLTPEGAARRLLDGAVEKIVKAVADAARQHDLRPDVPLVALGGAGEALVPLVAERLKRPLIRPEHPEVLSSIGAAVSLVRAEVTRNGTSAGAAVELALEAERACVASGAAPATVTVETAFDAREGVLRAVATGAVALEVGAAEREPAGDEDRLQAAARALGLETEALHLVAETGYYRVYSENGSGRVAAIDGLGAVALAEDARRVLAATGDELIEELRREVEAATRNLGVATLLPRVSLVCGSQILDLSDARRAEDVAIAAARTLAGHTGTAVAVITR
jgi:N-methylhydantoinase A/oxoprolinase/acetone carboxylase beta subunit